MFNEKGIYLHTIPPAVISQLSVDYRSNTAKKNNHLHPISQQYSVSYLSPLQSRSAEEDNYLHVLLDFEPLLQAPRETQPQAPPDWP